MKKKIALMLVVFSLCLCTVGCSNIDRASAADFSFSAGEMKSEVYRPGAYFAVHPQVTNVSDRTFRYVACQHDCGLSAQLYCMTEEGEYTLDVWAVRTEDVCRRVKYIVEPGETLSDRFDVSVPHDAPLGAYHMRIWYNGLTGTVENVFTLIE